MTTTMRDPDVVTLESLCCSVRQCIRHHGRQLCLAERLFRRLYLPHLDGGRDQRFPWAGEELFFSCSLAVIWDLIAYLFFA